MVENSTSGYDGHDGSAAEGMKNFMKPSFVCQSE